MKDNFEKNIRNWKIPALLSKEEAWQKLNARIEGKETKVIPIFTQRHVWVSLAASFALLVGMLFFINNDTTYTIEAKYGQKEVVALPDGSIATLNSGSSLSFSKDDFKNERRIELKGEAFFEVEKGSTFSVKTKQGTVTVLGTSFNVCDRNDFYRVSCASGKVKVEQGVSVQFLTKGQKTELLQNGLSNPIECDVASIDDWFDQDLYHFENMNLEDVFSELERQFNVKIGSKDISRELVNADVSLSNVETALDIVCTTVGLEYKMIKTGHFMINKK
ncbi:MAG: hypothetical protein HKN39_01040 [Flavobacteriales bacterium]|nr:hypothetical protein [Flavobacteriales bacterium]